MYVCICNHSVVNTIWTCGSFIPLYSCDYLKQISIKTNLATDEGNGRNET